MDRHAVRHLDAAADASLWGLFLLRFAAAVSSIREIESHAGSALDCEPDLPSSQARAHVGFPLNICDPMASVIPRLRR
jgi:hypothetical protein